MYKILVGTAKGLLVYEFRRGTCSLIAVHFKGFSINLIFADHRNNRWWIGISHKHWGEKLHFSDDNGNSWNIAKTPSFEGALLPNGEKARLREIWCMAGAGEAQPDGLWLGTDPGGLFYSNNNGQNFELVKSLWNHPSREKAGQWFGAGSDYPFIHTVLVDPTNSQRIIIAISCAGIFESLDGGNTWNPKNKGLKAAYLPNPKAEIGHDPHCVLMHPHDPQILWQQNHCGIYYTRNGGDQWHDVSAEAGIPYYGFALAIDEKDPAKAWVIPVESDEQRVAPNLKLQVYHTDNFGASWKVQTKGLEDDLSFEIVLRKGLVKKGEIVVFGTTSGNLFYSKDGGNSWKKFASGLAKVNTITLIP